MSVNWNMSIGSSLSLSVLHPNKQEIEAIKLHLQSMGFELKRGKKIIAMLK